MAHSAAEHAGHAEHDHAGMFRRRFWWSVAISLPVFAFSQMIRDWLGLPEVEGVGKLVAPLFGTALLAYGGQPFLSGAVSELRARKPGMMTLISLAITVAFAASAATALGLFDLEFWWELAALIDVMLLGHWLEMRAVGQARAALEALAELLPTEAERFRDGEVTTVPLDQSRLSQDAPEPAWAAGYNVLAIPLAAGVAAPAGFVLPPALGAVLMSLSTIVVAINAQLLRRMDLGPT